MQDLEDEGKLTSFLDPSEIFTPEVSTMDGSQADSDIDRLSDIA